MFCEKIGVKSVYRCMLLVIIMSLIITKAVFAQSRPGYGKPYASYTAPEGFTVTSYASNWNTTSKLKEVAKELLANEHGEEIAYLKNIYIYPDSPDGILAYTHFDLTRNYLGNYQYQDNAYIEIFDGNHYMNMREMAWVLSHEYGHHFTIYHLINKENKFFNKWQTTGYARARNIVTHQEIVYQADAIGDCYKWDIMEIAAEDYVQLFGSPNARRSVIYKDIQQQIDEQITSQFNYVTAFNMKPQDNLGLPLAADVRGLEQYWRNLAGLPKQTSNAVPREPNLRLISKKDVGSGRYQYKIGWDQLAGNEGYEYTLISYPDGAYEFPYPIKTVRPGEPTWAIVGNGLKTHVATGKQELVLDDYSGRYTFRLHMKDKYNKIYSSNPLHVNFNYPVIDYKGLYKDLEPLDWSYDAARQLYGRGIMIGSPDKYFYPLKSVTYYEFTTILNRINGPINWKPVGIKHNEITRDDMALLLDHYIRAKGLSIKETKRSATFKDYANISNKKQVNNLQKKGLIGGSNGYFYPRNNLTRQELASIVLRILKH